MEAQLSLLRYSKALTQQKVTLFNFLIILHWIMVDYGHNCILTDLLINYLLIFIFVYLLCLDLSV